MKDLSSRLLVHYLLVGSSMLLALSDHLVAAKNTITCTNDRRLQSSTGATIGSPVSGADVDLDSEDLADVSSIEFIGIDKENPMVYSKKTIGGASELIDEDFEAWYGEIDGDALGTATIIREKDGSIAGSFSDENFVYQMNTNSDGVVTMEARAYDEFEEEAEGDFPEGEETSPEPIKSKNTNTIGHHGRSLSNALRGSLAPSESQLKGVDVMDHSRKLQQGSTVDILCVVTRNAMCAEDSRCTYGAITRKVRLAETETNNAMRSSGMSTRIKVTRIHILGGSDFAETDRIEDALRFVETDHDIATIRDQVGADMVALIIDAPGACGYGNIRGPHSVTNRPCATGYYSFGHELAHGFGCYHNRGNSNRQPHPYAYGYQGTRYRSIMSYSCPGNTCPRVQRFSNTMYEYNGEPMGDSDNDCARNIDEVASSVAGWRTAPSLGTRCLDTPGWHDSDGPAYNCIWYAEGNNCRAFGADYRNFGLTANEACCVCQ